MTGIILVAHGSREKEAEIVLSKMVQVIGKKMNHSFIEYGFLEFSDQTIEKAVRKLYKKNIKRIIVTPYFLFHGFHVRESIPNEVNRILKEFSDLTIAVGNPIGMDCKIADILIDRMNEVSLEQFI